MTLGTLPRSPLFKARKAALPKVGVLKRKLHRFHENSASDLDILGYGEPRGRGRIEPPLRSLPLELSQLAARHPIGIGTCPHIRPSVFLLVPGRWYPPCLPLLRASPLPPLFHSQRLGWLQRFQTEELNMLAHRLARHKRRQESNKKKTQQPQVSPV